MDFYKLITALQNRLQRILPGALAHKQMMPAGREEEVSRIDEPEAASYRLGGVLILLFPYKNSICFPLTLRHTYPGVHSGQVSLPGGKKEDTDEDLAATALRETEEEIGVPANDIKLIGSLSELIIPPSRYKILPIIGFTEHFPQFLIDPLEVKELFIADVKHILDASYKKRKNMLVRDNYRLDIPYFDIHGQVVWGATGMVLSEFAHIIEELQNDGLV